MPYYKAQGVLVWEPPEDGKEGDLKLWLNPRAIGPFPDGQQPLVDFQPPLFAPAPNRSESSAEPTLHWKPSQDATDTPIDELPEPSRRFAGGYRVTRDNHIDADEYRDESSNSIPETWSYGFCGKCQQPVVDALEAHREFRGCNCSVPQIDS